MTTEIFLEKLNEIQKLKCETQNLELKSAGVDCPRRLYDTLSSFSNQDDGGIIIFGIDENNNYSESGVYDAQDLQKKVTEQCNQMSPVVRALFTVAEIDEKIIVAAEIPPCRLLLKFCHMNSVGNQLINTLIFCGGNRNNRDTQQIFHLIDPDASPICTDFIHHIQGNNRRNAKLQKLNGQV